MTIYRQPTNLPNVTFPLGLDASIQSLQQDLATNLSWLEYSFGRAYIGSDQQVKGKDYTYPAVYKGSKNYQDASPNDNLISQSFMVVDGDYEFDNDYQINQPNLITVPVSLIIWGNLKKIAPSTDEHFGHLLLQDALSVVRDNGDFKVRRVVDNDTEVFKEFSVSKESTSLFYYPYFCYRIEMEVATTEECREDILSTLQNYLTS
jgi:hypothetical protein